MKIQRVPSKWAKTKVILQNQSLSLYVPDTRKYDLSVLKEMLALYAMVYIKPDRGSFGIGVMRAEQRTVILSPSQQKTEINVTADNEERQQQEAQVLYILRYAKMAEVFFSPKSCMRPYRNEFRTVPTSSKKELISCVTKIVPSTFEFLPKRLHQVHGKQQECSEE